MKDGEEMTSHEIKQELEKQLQLLSEFSENKKISLSDRLLIAERIESICKALLSCYDWVHPLPAFEEKN